MDLFVADYSSGQNVVTIAGTTKKNIASSQVTTIPVRISLKLLVCCRAKYPLIIPLPNTGAMNAEILVTNIACLFAHLQTIKHIKDPKIPARARRKRQKKKLRAPLVLRTSSTAMNIATIKSRLKIVFNRLNCIGIGTQAASNLQSFSDQIVNANA
jgi:hypothetical protein